MEEFAAATAAKNIDYALMEEFAAALPEANIEREGATKQTFESMDLRSKKAVAAHLLLENANESNLVSDIANVDYLAVNLGRTNLRPLAGRPTFVDDIYVFGYLSREECVVRNGRLSCTSGENGSAKLVVASKKQGDSHNSP